MKSQCGWFMVWKCTPFSVIFFSRVWKYFSVVKFHYTSTTCRWQFTFLSFVSFLVIVCSLFVSSTEDGTLTKFHLPFHYVPRRRRHCLRLFLIFAKISEIIKQIEDLQRKHSLDRCGVLFIWQNESSTRHDAWQCWSRDTSGEKNGSIEDIESLYLFYIHFCILNFVWFWTIWCWMP